MPESFANPCACAEMPGTTVPPAPYVVSIAGLQGIIALDGTGVLQISTLGNTILFGLSAGAGLGTVTSVDASSSNSNLTVAGGPITTSGSFTFNLAGNLGSISGLTMAADQMLYSTGAATFVATTLTSFARTLLDDANNTAARSTLGLVIGTDVQAFSQDLADFVTHVSWSGDDFTSTGGASFGDAVNVSGALTATGLISGGAGGSFSGNVTAGTFTGDGSAITAISAANIATGTLAVARGGTNISSYAVGDLIYASGATTLAKLADVAAGSYLRSGGVTTAPLWSTLVLPNAGTTGDIFHATASNTMGRLTAVATGNVLLSGGVATISAWGKVTSTHTDGLTIATLSSGFNSNIAGFSSSLSFGDTVEFNSTIELNAALLDSADSEGNPGDILVSQGGSGVQWSTQIVLSTLTINTSLSMEATVTGGGTTGDQTINKLAGTVNFAGGASSLVVTNSLVTANSIIICTVLTNDTTALIKNVVATSGAFTIRLNAAATAETKVGFVVIQPS